MSYLLDVICILISGEQVGTLVWILASFSTLNATYTFLRTRKYRLFEADVEKEYNTPSAQRVRVQSSPAASSPMRFLTDLITSESAESRAHPDRTRDVWELSVWDPLPISLQICCWFGPGHVLVSWMFLPVSQLDAWPSIVGFKWFVLQGIISAQMYLLSSQYSQQNKDTAIIQKEVMHEYDTKFVHPHLYPIVRDASTQISQDEDGNDQEFVAVGTPTTVLRRGFKANPNPNYAKHIDPEGIASSRSSPSSMTPPGLFTPPVARHSDAFACGIKQRQAGLRHSTSGFSNSVVSRNSPAVSTSVSTSTGTTQTQNQPHGGYLGVYTHPSSPLKKAPSLGELQNRTPRNNSEMARLEQYQAYKDRSSSPVKSTRKSMGALPPSTQTSSAPWVGSRQSSNERYPSMWRH